jgi:hypothetical protein
MYTWQGKTMICAGGSCTKGADDGPKTGHMIFFWNRIGVVKEEIVQVCIPGFIGRYGDYGVSGEGPDHSIGFLFWFLFRGQAELIR